MPRFPSLARRHHLLSLLAAPFLLAGCGDDGGGPEAPVTLPVASGVMLAKAAQVRLVSGQPVLLALLGSDGGEPLEPAGAPTALRNAPAPARTMALALRAYRSRAEASGAAGMEAAGMAAADTRTASGRAQRLPQPFIPASMLGRTYVRDAATFEWRLDTLPGGSARPGAPSGGARFLVDDLMGDAGPVGRRLGTVDVIDMAGAGSTTTYRVRIHTLAGAEVADYVARRTLESLAPSVSTIGTILRGSERIALDEMLGLTRITGDAVAEFVNVTRTQVVSGAFLDESGDISAVATLVVDGATMRVRTALSATGGSFRLYAGDRLFAQMVWTDSATGPAAPEPEWTRADGRTPLDAEGEQALIAFYSLLGAFPALSIIDFTVQDWVQSAEFSSGNPFARDGR